MPTNMGEFPEYLSFNHQKEMDELLSNLGINEDEFCIIGSMPMHIYGLRENNDIDLLVSSTARDRLLPKIESSNKYKIESSGKIELSENVSIGGPNRFKYFGLSNDDIVLDEKYHFISGRYKIFRLELLLSKKFAERRPKDMNDVDLIIESGIPNTPQWNWDLVHVLPPWKRPYSASLLIHGWHSLKYYGLEETLVRIFKFGLEKSGQLPRYDNLKSKYQKIKELYELSSFKGYEHISNTISIAYVLTNHNVDRFNRWDLLLNCYNIDQNTDGRIENNIRTELNCGDGGVKINNNGELVEGIKHFSEKVIQCEDKVEFDRFNRDAEKVLIKDLKLSKKDEGRLQEYKNEVFKTSGVYFKSIIWPPGLKVFQEILNNIQKEVKIVSVRKYDLEDVFDQFVFDIYNIDERSQEWLIKNKISEMNGGEQIAVLDLEITNPRFCYNTGEVVYSEKARNIKYNCRRDMYNKIPNYTYDNMIHISDSLTDNVEIEQILSRYHDCKISQKYYERE